MGDVGESDIGGVDVGAGEIFRIAIVGSGPAGLSAAAHAARLGLSHVLLEKTDHLCDTIHRYQRGKAVMSTPEDLPLRADLPFKAGSREAVLGTWAQAFPPGAASVRLRAEVVGVSGVAGDFTLTLNNGPPVRAETIVLAVGTQGNPNRMACEGAHLPLVQYQLDDPTAFADEHIFVIGGGDSAIENALGLAADPDQANTVAIVHRQAEFSRAKDGNVARLMSARDSGRLTVFTEATPQRIEAGEDGGPGWITLRLPDGPRRLRCDRVIARLGSAPARAFVESFGVTFPGKDKDACPELSPHFETRAKGVYLIGALAGYPLIKHCINQGHDVVEYINGSLGLPPADEPVLKARLEGLPGNLSVSEWLERLRRDVEILRGLSPLQMREFMMGSRARHAPAGSVIFERGAVGSSLFGIAAGSVKVEVDPADPLNTVTIGAGSFFGEAGLISGRRRNATVRAAEACILVEISRTAALKLMAQVAEARDTVDRIQTQRAVLSVFGPGLSAEDIQAVMATATVRPVRIGETILREGEQDYDLYIIRRGSMVVERTLGGKTVCLNYIPAGGIVGEGTLLGAGRRNATVRAAIDSQVIGLNGDRVRALLARKPALEAGLRNRFSARVEAGARIEGRFQREKGRINSVIDYHVLVDPFLVREGAGEATDVLLIDERLCVGCDNCEKACADTHEGLSRLDREAGATVAGLHVPTSCRHCEDPKCMKRCPTDAIRKGSGGEVFISAEACIGCGNCEADCPYKVIRMDKPPPKRPGLLAWMLLGLGPGPGEPPETWKKAHAKAGGGGEKKAIKCDMCAGRKGGPACVRACPTGAAIRVSPEAFLSVARLGQARG
jgi:Fe-S-cluster-containing hydrogenase component 2/CRP-like cAMP-binding protein/thioredoxin reductase